MPLRVALLVAALAAGCSAPATLGDLRTAERAEREGRVSDALAAYDAARVSCRRVADPMRRRAACAEAYLRRAEVLAGADRQREAAEAFAAIPRALPDDTAAAAQACLRAGELWLELGDAKAAYTSLWRAVTDFPDEAFAADALGDLLRDGRRRDPVQLFALLGELSARLDASELGDNLDFARADLAVHERGDPREAIELYDHLAAAHPQSGLRDDAYWLAAQLARQDGDSAGAATRLRRLLATREVSWGMGSYFSVWLDDAQLELGQILRDDLRDPKDALAAFARVAADYPASTLCDDAEFERAVTLDQLGQGPAACAALDHLAATWPDSKYLLERAPALRRSLACPQPAGSGL